MSNNFVKILIKAPNQLVDDQTVHCERSWTVKRLKHHLAKVYPCKPHPEGQKLIYSGQLLSDEAVLSEVLRSYDGLENNTIHLVCSMRDVAKMTCHQVNKPAQPPQELNTFPRETENVRQQSPNLRPPPPSAFQSANTNPQNFFQQTLLYQQAYFNYMAHVSQMYMMTNRMGSFDYSAHHNYFQNAPVNGSNQDVNDDTRNIPANDRIENEVDEGPEDGRINRDWLEWFYMGSRLFILFTLVYFYSSPERFIMVIAMILILINIDVFRWRRVHQNQPVNAVNPTDDVNEVSPPPENVVVPPNWIHVTWTFMKTFFLSIVPDNRDI